jgi:glycosyltransferase involved in cell wall biosynthesis
MPRVLMLFNRPRAARLDAVARGQCPDELLYGLQTLRARGWDVVTDDAGFAPFFGGRLLKAIDNLLSRGGRRTGFHLKQAWRLRRLCGEVDLIFATADSSGLPALLLQAIGFFKTPIVYASIGLAETFGPPTGLIHAAYRRLLRRAAKVIVYSRAELDALARSFGVARDKLVFVPFGVDPEFARFDDAAAGPPLAFGLDHRRDWPTLFAAAAGLETTVEVIANPDVLRGLAAPRNVALLPPEDSAALRDRLARARYVVLAVKQNNYSGGTISLLQAMAAGRAVIVSQTDAIATGYGLVDGENVLLTPPGDVPALAAAMQRLEADADLRARLGVAAAAHVRAHHTLAHLADGLEAVWREALA